MGPRGLSTVKYQTLAGALSPAVMPTPKSSVLRQVLLSVLSTTAW